LYTISGDAERLFHYTTCHTAYTGSWDRHTKPANLLDLILTAGEESVTHINYGAPMGNNGHSTLTFEYHCFAEVTTDGQEKFLYHKGNYTEMASELTLDWDELLGDCDNDPDQQYNLLVAKIKEAQEHHIPKTSCRRSLKKRKFPLNHVTRRLIAKKHTAWRRFMETRSEDRRRGYVKLRNKVTKACRQAKKLHEENIAHQAKENPKCFWRYANSKLKMRVGVSDLRKPNAVTTDGEPVLASSDGDKAEVLAEFFSSVFVDEPDGEVPQPAMAQITTPFHWEDITDEMVRKKRTQLDSAKSQGPDLIHPRVLKELSDTLA
jgi:hypothetical protein